MQEQEAAAAAADPNVPEDPDVILRRVVAERIDKLDDTFLGGVGSKEIRTASP